MHRSSFLFGVFVTGLFGWGGSGAGSASANPLPPPTYRASISSGSYLCPGDFPLTEISNSDSVSVGCSVSLVGPVPGVLPPGFFNERGGATAGQAAVGSSISSSAILSSEGPIRTQYESQWVVDAEFQDYLQFSGPADATATLTGAIILEGLIDAAAIDGLGSGSGGVATAQINLGGSVVSWQGTAATNLSPSCSYNGELTDIFCFDLGQYISHKFPISTSVSFDDNGNATVPLNIYLITTGGLFARQECDIFVGTCDSTLASLQNAFGETLFWDGIISLESDSGPIDVSVISSSGFDYRLSARPVNSVTVPGPLPLLGVGAAFGFSRKLRKRIKSSKLPVASAID